MPERATALRGCRLRSYKATVAAELRLVFQALIKFGTLLRRKRMSINVKDLPGDLAPAGPGVAAFTPLLLAVASCQAPNGNDVLITFQRQTYS